MFGICVGRMAGLGCLTLVACSSEVELAGTTSQAMSHDGQAEDSGDHMGGHGYCAPGPVMEVGDFDGDGVVTRCDLQMVSSHAQRGLYAAFFDLDADGSVDGADVSILAQRLRQPGTPRDAQMARLWAAIEPYVDLQRAIDDGYEPFTPDLQGHGVHWVNFEHINSWPSRGFQAGVPEGLNYSDDGELLAAFYYAPAAVDLSLLAPGFPEATYYASIPVPPSFADLVPEAWHNHTGACFGGATPVPGFDQCLTGPECDAVGGTTWAPKFHMLHVWLFAFNECGPFAGLNDAVSQSAPPEPNHMACDLVDVVPTVVPEGTVPLPEIPTSEPEPLPPRPECRPRSPGPGWHEGRRGAKGCSQHLDLPE